MGSLLSRSASRGDGSKSLWKKTKVKKFRRMETPIEDDKYIDQNDNEHKHTNGTLINSHDEWSKIDQQQLSNMHGDPPGAPATYSANFLMNQNDIMTQSWSSHHDGNNQFYQVNSLPVTTTANLPYDPNQYVHRQMPNTFLNQSQPAILEERPSKKVQFARPMEQSKTTTTNPQTWYEQRLINNDISNSTSKQEAVLNRSSVQRPIMPKTSVSLPQESIEKPIYVGIDHRATLAGRGQTTAHKHHHKNNSDPSTNNHRQRSHTSHQRKHQDSTDSSTTKSVISSAKSVEALQTNPSNTHRQLTTTSTSTIIPNKAVTHHEQILFNDNDVKIPKSRNNRQHTEVNDNDAKVSRSRTNHTQQRSSQQQQQQQRTSTNRNNSPLRTDPVRKVDSKQASPPVMRISMPQTQRPKSTVIPTTTTTNSTRTRV